MKKLALFLGLFIFNSFVAMAASFPDVGEDYKNYQAIEYLYGKQIIQGYPEGNFGPENLVNRAEAAKIILNAFGISHDGEYEEAFPDVEKGVWYFEYIMGGKAAGLINGYQDGTFKPGETVNLAETLKMVSVAAGVNLPTDLQDVFYTDVKLDAWFAPYFLYARNHNVLLADDYGAVHPDQAMTRAAFAEVVYRLMIVKEKNQSPFPLETQWETYQSGNLPFEIKYDSDYWIAVEKANETVFLKPDSEFMQFSDTRIYPNTGLVKFVLDKNQMEMDSDEYFENIGKAFTGASHKKFTLSGLPAFEVLYPKEKIVDWYIYLDNGDVLVVYTQYGQGILGYQTQQFIKAMLSTLSYREVSGEILSGDTEKMMSKIFENTLVEGAGSAVLDLITDKMIIETDAIGVGTGPVDYYHSASLNYTIKYERDSGTILDSREGKTSAF